MSEAFEFILNLYLALVTQAAATQVDISTNLLNVVTNCNGRADT